MVRFAVFVDGSNLFGALKAMNLAVEDYESLYKYVFKEAVAAWSKATHQTEKVPTQLQRVYWYEVGSIDEWDLNLAQSQTALRNAVLSRQRDQRILARGGRQAEPWPERTGTGGQGMGWVFRRLSTMVRKEAPDPRTHASISSGSSDQHRPD